MQDTSSIEADSTMEAVLEVYPGAQRALFRRYHIGGCSSCGFQPMETLAQVCERNNHLNAAEVLAHIQQSHLADEKIWIDPEAVRKLMTEDSGVRLLDIRSRAEFDAVHISNSLFMTRETTQEIMSQWERTEQFIIVDHMGRQGLDAAAYFMGHGFLLVRCLKGGIDAWSREVDPSVPRYQLA